MFFFTYSHVRVVLLQVVVQERASFLENSPGGVVVLQHCPGRGMFSVA